MKIILYSVFQYEKIIEYGINNLNDYNNLLKIKNENVSMKYSVTFRIFTIYLYFNIYTDSKKCKITIIKLNILKINRGKNQSK